jgi:NifB/MoaA-like Fe-S oxidoreductase
MFSKNKDGITLDRGNVIQRRTFEQIEMEQMSEILDEMREEIKTLKESIPEIIRGELRTFRAKFESWENINSMMDSIKQREQEIRSKEIQQSELRTIVPELRVQIHQAVKDSIELYLKEYGLVNPSCSTFPDEKEE